jgi:glucose-6-phosphate isomerase
MEAIMEELKMFGMPILFDEATDKLSSSDKSVNWEDYARKYSEKMFGLLAENEYKVKDNPYYDFYKAIVKDNNKAEFTKANLRYDSTVIMRGCADKEFKKTAGHFHHLIPGKNMSYPELYQVIKGTALFVMQKVDDFNKSSGKMTVEDVIMAEVKAGQAVVIPPDYGHCTINISDETMVFINLISLGSSNHYDSVKNSHGMCCYAYRNEDGTYRIEKNPNYKFNCDVRITVPSESKILGIRNDTPVYTEFLKNPGKFDYLNNPENNLKDYFSLLKTK